MIAPSVRFIVALALFAPAAVSGDQAEYVLIDLTPAADSEMYCEATGVNDRGEITVVVNSPTAYNGFVWNGKNVVDLPVGSCPTAINDRGQVVGRFGAGGHGFIWERGVLTEFGNQGMGGSRAAAVNNRGQVVGEYTAPSASQRAFFWSDGVFTDLGTLPGSIPESSSATAINDRGQIVGWAVSPDQPYNVHAVLWEKGAIKDLGTLVGPTDPSAATGINSRGQVAGWSRASSGSPIHACMWDDGVIKDLGVPGFSRATAINNSGQIVGTFSVRRPMSGFLWDKGVVTELKGLGGDIVNVYGVNNRGQVVGSASLPDGRTHAVLWEKR
ncbi:MAG TPA: hypothetical protein VN442_16970 [Bryobacteraceae bacterium]|nr:hypothetical protein [Bryobacteraceae bacterium]